MEQVYVYDLSRHFPPKPPFLKIGKEINRGAYGAVYQGKFGLEGRSVAVKKLHRILQEASHDELTSLFDNFKKECILLEKAENDHVVQFHGAYYDEESREPILVMERMYENLSEHLKNNRGRLSLSRQLQICLEIVNGVHFLHSLVPPVIHRDLNDKNVMLTKEGLVKVGDLGQSRLKDVNRDHFSTRQPGAVPFMPPEALRESARYNEKIDTFSVGVLMLEVATQQSPQVSLVGIGIMSELERREKDLAKLPGDHPMRPLILNCLKDNPEERPDMATLMKKIQMIIEERQTVEIVVKKFPELVGLEKWIICREKLKIMDSLRINQYFDVLTGEYKGEKVEVKSLKDECKGFEDFLEEASVLTSLSHPNLVKLIGVSVDRKPVYFITEFMEKGSLLDYLRSRDSSVIQKSHQAAFAQDVCSGMTYLEQRDLVHRDIAAKNVLLSADNIAKVANVEFAVKRGNIQKPMALLLKWTAPEAIESCELSNKSDVWSFGIFLWEVYTFGRKPYQHANTLKDMQMFIKEGGRLDCPEKCPPEVYEIMKTCWYERPEDRPTFKELLEELKALPPSNDHDGYTLTSIPIPTSEPVLTNQPKMSKSKPGPVILPPKSPKPMIGRKPLPTNETTATGTGTGTVSPASEGKERQTVEIVVEEFPELEGLEKWIICMEKLKVMDLLRINQYFDVLTGEYKGEKVEVKSLKDECNEFEDFLEEASILTSLSHPNLVKLIGVSVDRIPVYFITEFMEKGSLLDYLRSRDSSVIQKSHQAAFAQDVCSGMTYLEQRDLVHRDVAARNVLLSADNIAKVANVEFAVKRGNIQRAMALPTEWTAPEAIKSLEFSNKSDVWSFGIFLWEVYTFGRKPYQHVADTLKDMQMFIKEGGRLDCPENCPPEVYEIMKTCWYERPEERPTFKELLEELKALPPSYERPEDRPTFKELLEELKPLPPSDAHERQTVEIVVKEFPELEGLEKWIICREKLKIMDSLRSGQYFDVLSGEYKGEKVEVKSLEDECNGLEDFLLEAPILTSLSHPNLVKLIGVSVDKKPVYFITEFMEKGSLSDYLQSKDRSVIQKSHQAAFAQDVCSGMAYLEQRDLVHRDVAARNVLLSADKIAKVANVEFAVKKGNIQKAMELLLKWTAPEAIISFEFSNKSDVWSFGVLLWEVYSFGRTPYQHVADTLKDMLTHIKEGGRLNCPENCPPEVYEIMKTCWFERPEDRPTFKELLEELKALPLSDDHDGYTLTSKLIPTSEPVPTNQPNMPNSKPGPVMLPPKPPKSPVGRKPVSTNETTGTATGSPVSGRKEKPWKPGTVVVAKYQFKGITSFDLPFEKGDHLTITSASGDPNWYKARREDGMEGMLPANFVRDAQGSNKKLEKKSSKKPSHENIPKAVVQPHQLMLWFHGKISRSEAESRLNPKQNGLYLVRESINFPGDYVLCVCYQKKIEHYHIKFKDNMYTIDDEEEFDNLMQLVEHHQKDADGLVTRLCVPVAKEGKQCDYTVDMDDFKKFGWNIPRNSLKFSAQIGKGEFAEAFIGEYKGKKVAIKSVKDGKGLQDFLAEAAVMTSLSHPNLVKLIGISVDEMPFYIITEFLEKGSLFVYLRSRDKSVIQKSHLAAFAQDVCNGMAYLEQRDLVHRDVAARNILVSGENIAKVSNFHLTIGRGSGHQGDKTPMQWMALEAIELGEFSNKSDVWSFGVLLWEVYSFGRIPYLMMPVSDVMTHIEKGGRLDCPENCPPEVYKIMKSCWFERPEDRPTFKELLEQLKALPLSACQP